MAICKFQFYAELNDFLSPERRGRAFRVAFDRRASVKDMIESLGVPHAEVEVILANGAPVGFGHPIADGERYDVYPPSVTPGVAPIVPLRPPLEGQPRFVLDTQLGTLARYLRLCGFDTLYRNDYEDVEIAAISADEGRVLLTRDRAVLKRKVVTHGYFLRNDQPRRQLTELSARYELAEKARPFTRCAACNGTLEDVPKEDVEHRLEPLTRKYFETFRGCSRCGKIYWQGSHYPGIRALLGGLATRDDQEKRRST